MEIRALIFDVDGVLTDTLELHYRSWAQLAREEDLSFDRGMNDRMLGLSRPESLRIFLGDRQVNEELTRDYLRRKNDCFLRELTALGPADLFPGVLPLLHRVSAGDRWLESPEGVTLDRILSVLAVQAESFDTPPCVG